MARFVHKPVGLSLDASTHADSWAWWGLFIAGAEDWSIGWSRQVDPYYYYNQGGKKLKSHLMLTLDLHKYTNMLSSTYTT